MAPIVTTIEVNRNLATLKRCIEEQA